MDHGALLPAHTFPYLTLWRVSAYAMLDFGISRLSLVWHSLTHRRATLSLSNPTIRTVQSHGRYIRYANRDIVTNDTPDVYHRTIMSLTKTPPQKKMLSRTCTTRRALHDDSSPNSNGAQGRAYNTTSAWTSRQVGRHAVE